MADVQASPSPAEEQGGAAVDEQAQEQGAQGVGGVDAPGGSEPGEVASKKPKGPKEKAPGVFARVEKDDDDFGFLYRSKDGRRISRAEAEREADEELAEEAGLKRPERKPVQKQEAPKPEPKKQEAPNPNKFKFAGEEFESQEAAEQSIRSLRGMFKPMQERLANAERLAAQAAEEARIWRQRAEGTSPTPPAAESPRPTAASAAEELNAVLQNVDGEMFERLARTEGGLPMAGRYLAAQVLAAVHDQMLPALRDQIMQELVPRIEPGEQSLQFQQQTQEVGNLIDQMSQLRNPNGEQAFPELDSAEELAEIAELWSSSGRAEATPESLIQAIALYRLYRSSRGGSQPVVNVPPPPNVAPRSQPIEAGGEHPAPTSRRAGQGSENDLFARALLQTELVDKNLGFAVRRRQ